MTAAQLFSLANTLALVTWIGLIAFQRTRIVRDRIVPAVVAVFAIAYAVLIARYWSGSSGGFGSLAAVSLLFANDRLLLAGWLHYLAFDLLVGRWEAGDAAERGLSPWLAAPCLALTFMFGPAGWLAYLVVRRVRA
ncbi:MAG: ABA4-like family protein [Vicinamibacterales bacterium]